MPKRCILATQMAKSCKNKLCVVCVCEFFFSGQQWKWIVSDVMLWWPCIAVKIKYVYRNRTNGFRWFEKHLVGNSFEMSTRFLFAIRPYIWRSLLRGKHDVFIVERTKNGTFPIIIIVFTILRWNILCDRIVKKNFTSPSFQCIHSFKHSNTNEKRKLWPPAEMGKTTTCVRARERELNEKKI